MRKNIRLVLQAFVVAWISFVHAQSFEDLEVAVERGETHKVEALLNHGLDPNTTDDKGMTILMKAARLGHPEVVKLLLARKASISRQAPAGDTALMHGCLGGNLEVVRQLLDAGSRVNQAGWSPLHYAAFGGSGAIVRLLLERGAEKDAVAPNGYTAVMLAARNGNQDATRELIGAKVNLGRRGPGGENALQIAIKSDHKEVADLLRKAGLAE